MRALVLVLVGFACGHTADAPTLPADDLVSHHAGSGDRARARFHMKDHVESLREIERHLVAGRLDEAKALAFLLGRADDRRLLPAAPDAARVAIAARALAAATTLEEGCRLEPRIALACAGCHRRARLVLHFPAPVVPADEPTVAARMTRHQWAADRLWDGLIGPDDRSWRAGLEVYAAAPVPALASPGVAGARSDADDRSSRRLQGLARTALDAIGRDSADDRAATYGALLVTCTGCHAKVRVAAGDRR